MSHVGESVDPRLWVKVKVTDPSPRAAGPEDQLAGSPGLHLDPWAPAE